MKLRYPTSALPTILLLFGGALLPRAAPVGAVVACGSDTGGSTYAVGPNQPHAALADVPLDALQAGDWVCVYPGTYREKFVVNRSGTAAAPIVIKGVPDAAGNLPILDGDGATTPTYLDYWGESRNIVKIGAASSPTPDGGGVVEHVRIEGLRVQNARLGLPFTGDNGGGQSYVKNAACLHIEQGRHISLVGNEITGCGNGIFVSPGDSEDIVIERNHIWGNGHSGSVYEHNVYTEANRITYKYNRFGPLCSTCLGNNLKDRSAGLIVAYNFIEGGNRQLDIVDSTNYDTFPNYDDTFVYGNIMIENDVNNGNRQIIHYGGDGGNSTRYRTGTLHFYHNTLLSTRSGKTTLVRLSSDSTSMDARNNIIYVKDVDAGDNLELLAERRGALTLTNNWLRPGYFNWVEASYGGSVTEVGTVLEAATGDIFEDSNFDAEPYDLHLVASLAFAATLAAGVPSVDMEYAYHMSNGARSSMDLGAFGYASQNPQPTRAPTTAPSRAPTKTTQSPTGAPSSAPVDSGYCSDGTERCAIGGDASECGCYVERRRMLKGSMPGQAGQARRKLPKKTTAPQPTSRPTTAPPTKVPTAEPTSSPTAPVPCECLATAPPTGSPTVPPTSSPMESCKGQGEYCDLFDDNCCNGCQLNGNSNKVNKCKG